jgi:hypothetical protein
MSYNDDLVLSDDSDDRDGSSNSVKIADMAAMMRRDIVHKLQGAYVSRYSVSVRFGPRDIGSITESATIKRVHYVEGIRSR